MAAWYADENVSRELVNALRARGHDVLTAREDGRADQQIPDPDVLARAAELGRAVLSANRWDFRKLHNANPNHAGIVLYTDDRHDRVALAARIDAAVALLPSLAGQLVRVNLPNRPPPQVP